MTAYIGLLKFNESPKRGGEEELATGRVARGIAEIENHGARFLSILWSEGDYDMVLTLESKDEGVANCHIHQAGRAGERDDSGVAGAGGLGETVVGAGEVLLRSWPMTMTIVGFDAETGQFGGASGYEEPCGRLQGAARHGRGGDGGVQLGGDAEASRDRDAATGLSGRRDAGSVDQSEQRSWTVQSDRQDWPVGGVYVAWTQSVGWESDGEALCVQCEHHGGS